MQFRYAFRTLAKRPGFLAAAAAVLALGIGANTAIFSLVNAFLLKPLVMRHPEQVVGLYSRDATKPGSYRAFSYPNYADIRAHNTVFSSLTAHNLAMVGIAQGPQTRRAFADVVSSNYFETLGVPLFRGRTFNNAEERPGSGIPAAIVSYPFWQKAGADPAILGKTVRVNGRDFQIIGIAPQGFTGTTALLSADLYLPLGMYEAAMNDFEGHGRPLGARDNHCLILVGRLRPGVTAASAAPQLAALSAQLAEAFPAENKNQTFLTHPLARMSVSDNPGGDGGIFTLSTLLLAASGVVLLIASLNLANMMLARGSARRREIAVRMALGAGRAQIVRQLLTEGLVLSLVGGVGGLVTAYWSTLLLVRSLERLAPFELVYNAAPDVRVLAATLGFCLFSMLLFSLAPAWNLSRPDLVPALKSSEREEGGGKPRRLFSRRNVLVVCQVSLSLALLTAAGLFVQSSLSADRMNPGFRIDNELVLETDASLAGYPEARGRQIYPRLLDRLRSLPGVQSAAIGATVPFGLVSMDKLIRATRDAKPLNATYNPVGTDYFRNLDIPLLRGREFSAADESPTATPVIIDQLAAERLWPGQDPLGKHLLVGSGDSGLKDKQVIGVVGATREHFLGEDLSPHLFVPYAQEYVANAHIHLKASGAALESVRRAVGAEDPHLPILELDTMRGHLERSFDYWLVRTGARMFGIFGGVAMLLATIGLYAVRSYSVAMRTREIGIRMALGARPGEALSLVLREGLLLTAVGIGIGLPLAFGLTRVLGGMLYGVGGSAVAVMAFATVLLAAVATAACLGPARRAATVDPLSALRYE